MIPGRGPQTMFLCNLCCAIVVVETIVGNMLLAAGLGIPSLHSLTSLSSLASLPHLALSPQAVNHLTWSPHLVSLTRLRSG